MRYYSIVLTNANTGALIRPPSLAALNLPASYTSFVNNQSIPGALQVELDLPTSVYAQPMKGSLVRIWGISLQEISQAMDLNGQNIAIYGGMQKGLPLANPAQSGLLVQGSILQAFGNWVETSQTLDLILQPPLGLNSAPANISFSWPKNTSMQSAIVNALKVAFPKFTVSANISTNLTQSATEVGFYATLEQFSAYVSQRSIALMKNANYSGVQISVSGSTILVFDNTTTANPRQIQFQDLIGQPTWIDPSTVQAKLVMRADLKIGDVIQFPQAVTTTTAESNAALATNQKLTFQGKFQINMIRHVGNFRQPDANSWNTTINAFALNPTFVPVNG